MNFLSKYPRVSCVLVLRVAELAFRECDPDLAYITSQLNADTAADAVTMEQVRDAIVLLMAERVVTYGVEKTQAVARGLKMLARDPRALACFALDVRQGSIGKGRARGV